MVFPHLHVWYAIPETHRCTNTKNNTTVNFAGIQSGGNGFYFHPFFKLHLPHMRLFSINLVSLVLICSRTHSALTHPPSCAPWHPVMSGCLLNTFFVVSVIFSRINFSSFPRCHTVGNCSFVPPLLNVEDILCTQWLSYIFPSFLQIRLQAWLKNLWGPKHNQHLQP